MTRAQTPQRRFAEFAVHRTLIHKRLTWGELAAHPILEEDDNDKGHDGDGSHKDEGIEQGTSQLLSSCVPCLRNIVPLSCRNPL